MRKIVKTSAFKKDYKRVLKRGFPPEALIEILELLISREDLPTRCRPHKLVGNYVGLWECHISPDWLLIYELSPDDSEVVLRRTGTHSDLF